MGNQLSAACSLQSIERLNLNPQQKQNLNLYIWRASSQSNMYIPKVKLNPQYSYLSQKQTSVCINQKDTLAPNLMFEDFLCDFRQLKSSLDVSQLLTVFKMVIKGHQTIFTKFNASIVSEKCSFLTPDGQIRVWINPNYYLNEFWSVQIQRRQVRSKTEFIHNLSNHQPRFMNRQQFESKSVGLVLLQHVLIRKIVHLILNLARNSEQSQKFKYFIENQLNMLKINQIKFGRVQYLIDHYAKINKIMIKHNIQQAVKRLVSEGAIFHTEKCSLRSLKETRKTIHTMQTKQNSTFIKNPTNFQQSNIISILDVKTQSMSKMNNFRTFSKPNLHSSIIQKQQIETQNTQNFSNFFAQKPSFNKSKPEHKRKLSKSLVQPTIQYEPAHVQYFEHISDKQSFKKKVIPFKEIQQVKTQQQHSKKLSYSFQYSINLYTSQTNNLKQRSSQYKNNEFRPQTQRSHTYRQNSQQQISNMKDSLNSKPSSILKKGNMKSFDVGKSFNGFLNSDRIQNHKQKKLVFDEPITFDHLQDVQKGKQLCISTFDADNFNDKTVENRNQLNSKDNQYSDEIIDDLDETKKTTIRNRQCSNENVWSIQSQKPFQEITKQQIFIKENENQNKLLSKTFLNPQSRYSINNHRGQISMLINVKNVDKQKKETLIISKRRISVGGGQVETENKPNGSNSHNFLGLDAIKNNQNNENHTSRTITRLMSSQNILQTSVGSFSSFGESQANSQTSKYTGILTKMGRNVPLRKVSDDYIKEILENQRPNTQMMQIMSKKKKTIVELGSNRSLKY